MPRARRHIKPGVVYHLISRFVDRAWFITSSLERTSYLTLLGRAISRYDWGCLAYAIMSNHIHLAVIAGKQSLASWVRRVHSPFADWMNRRHDRIGSLFVRGPKDFEIAPDRVGALIAYIHNNPVRAGVVASPGESRWTSHRAYLGVAPTPAWLGVSDGLARAGFQDPCGFDQWVIDPDNHDLATTLVERQQPPANADQRVGIGTQIVRPDPRSIVEATASELGLSVAQLCSRRRGSIELVGRQVAVQCAEMFGLTGVDIAVALGLSQQGVSAIRRRAGVDVHEMSSRVWRLLAAGPMNDTCRDVTSSAISA